MWVVLLLMMNMMRHISVIIQDWEEKAVNAEIFAFLNPYWKNSPHYTQELQPSSCSKLSTALTSQSAFSSRCSRPPPNGEAQAGLAWLLHWGMPQAELTAPAQEGTGRLLPGANLALTSGELLVLLHSTNKLRQSCSPASRLRFQLLGN